VTDAVLDRAALDAVGAALVQAGERNGPLECRLVSGGRSNLTFALEDGRSRWILRTPPRAGRTPSAHDVGREFRVTQGLARAGFPVARPVVARFEEDNPVGGPFAVWEFVDGWAVRTQTELAAISDERVEQTVVDLVRRLADLHEVDFAAVGLADFGRPEGYLERQVRRWSDQWALVSQGDDAGLERDVAALGRRLGDRLPARSNVAIVHGDYRIDNTLIDLSRVTPRIAAVVDWELSTLGDPVSDVAMMCAYRDSALDAILGFDAAWTSDRLPSAAALAESYASASGRDLAGWSFYLGLAYFKIAVIAAGIAHRHRASGGDGPDTAGAAVAPLVAAGLDVLAAPAG